jgi:hypothetical protein
MSRLVRSSVDINADQQDRSSQRHSIRLSLLAIGGVDKRNVRCLGAVVPYAGLRLLHLPRAIVGTQLKRSASRQLIKL